MRNYIPAFLLAVLWVSAAGCQRPGPRFNPYKPAAAAGPTLQSVTASNRIHPEWLRPSTEPFTLGPGDRLEIELLDDPTSRALTAVGPDGKIYFHLLPGVDVWGLTLAQTKEALERELSKFIKDHIQISIVLRTVDSKRVWLLGRLQAPGVYSMTNNLTLLEAISMAGGTLSLTSSKDSSFNYSTDDLADLRRSFVMRKGNLLPIDFQRLLKEGDLSQNIYLQPDDFIYLPAATAREVFVMGAVAQPRAVSYNDDMTLVSAIANTLGTISDAYLSHVAVVRGSLTQPQIAIVDYKEIVKGKAPDVRLQAGDIVYVPFTPYRYLSKYADVIMQTFVSSVAINEGARAVLKTPSTPAGVFIPLGSGIRIIK